MAWAVGNAALRTRLFDAVPRDTLEVQVAGLDEWVTGKKSDVFHGLVRRFSHLRQFSPVLLRALEFIPPERLVITTDCGFGREGLSRRIAHYKCVSMVEGTNIVRRELGLPEAHVRAARCRVRTLCVAL